MEYDTSYPTKGTTENQYNIYIEWSHNPVPWNEICIKVIEVFGLPGNRYVHSSTPHLMIFRFKSEKDFILAEILLSEYMIK